MIKNYLKIALRNLLRNKLYSFLNIGGLALGMAASILILLWVTNEVSYNKFNKRLDRIFLVPQTQHYQTIGDFTVQPTPMPLAQRLKDDYPQVEWATRYEPWLGKRVLSHNDVNFDEQINFADSSFFKFFSFHFLEGDARSALTDPNSIVLTKETATKFFGNEDPVGKSLQMDDTVDLRVTGVIADVPENSDLQFDGLVPTEVMKYYGINVTQWGSNMIATYVLLKHSADAKEVSRKISGILKRVSNSPTAGKLFLFPFRDFHLYSFTGKGGRIDDVIIFSIVALFILIIASINFMNLATARSTRRATEVGIKKVVGATRFQIAKQFFGESIIVTMISLLVSLVLVEAFLPYFDELTDKSLRLSQINLMSVLLIVGVTVVTGVLAGIYPSVILSSFMPASTLKKTGSDAPGRFSLRRILVVAQFAISIALIIGTSVVYFQLKYIHNKNLGMKLTNVVYFPATQKLDNEIDRLENELKSEPGVLDVTSTQHPPIAIYSNGGGWSWEGMPADQTALVSITYADYGYIKTFDMTLSSGRFFSKEHPGDDSTGVVINQSFANLIGNKSPVGMPLRWFGNSYTVIGVVKDFNFYDLHRKIGPLAIFYSPQSQYVCLKVSNKDLSGTMNFIDKTCKDIDPGFVFDYHFLDKTFEKMYVSDRRLGNIVGSFSFLAIIIACLGLFGLSAHAAETKTKEIGVRKVLGASIPNIMLLLSKELVSWVAIANLIAWPLAYYFMDRWLRDFAYRINLNVWIFLVAGGTALVIALATVGYQAIKAATANPIESLRYE